METSPYSRLVALLLAFVIGMFGAHRFYVGKTGSAVAQLVFTLSILGSFISGIWVFIDIIIIALGDFTDREGRKLTNWDIKSTTASSSPDDIEKYAELRDKGIISEEEFTEKKKKILGE